MVAGEEEKAENMVLMIVLYHDAETVLREII